MPFAELSDIRCYYELLGSGDPLLLIPGLGGTCSSWDCAANELASQATLIMPELRGVGRSEAKRPARNLSYLVADLVELIDYLGLDQTNVLGLSLGGIVAQEFAIEHPSRVSKLVLVSCAHRFGPYLREIASFLGNALRHLPRDAYERMFETLGSAPEYIDAHPEVVDQRVQRVKARGASRRSIAHQLRCLGFNDVGRFGYEISTPTLVISGANDVIIPACFAKQMAEEIPNSTQKVIPRCGHNPLMERPEVAVPMIHEFLNERPEPARPYFANRYQLPLEEFV
jgi:pimeloyl-ACP methyl ester carboxylesterase